jgi:MFS family permease
VDGGGATRLAAVRTVLADRRLSRALRGYTTYAIGVYGSWLAILLIAYDRGGVGEVGWVATIMLVPAAALGPFVAGAADWFPRHLVLTIGFAIFGASLAATGVAALLQAPAWAVYALAIVASVVLIPAPPAIASVLPAVARTTDQLTAANVTVGLVETFGQLLGPLLAGLILLVGAPGHVLVALGVIGIVGAIATIGAVNPDADTLDHDDDPERSSTLVELVAGFRLCLADGQVRALVLTIAVTGLIVGAVDVGATTLAIGILDRSESMVSVFSGAFGLGAVVGAALSFTLVGRRRLAVVVTAGLLMSCVVFGLVGWSGSVVLTIAMLFGAGAGVTLTAVGARTMLQGLTPDDTLARLFALNEALFNLAIAAGGALLSFVAVRVGLAQSFAVVGVLGVVVTLINIWRLVAIDAARRPVDADVVELARSSPVFGPLPAYAMEQILHGLAYESFGPHEAILARGEPGDRMFLVADGEVIVRRDGAEPVIRGRGAHLGEIAILRNAPRNADVEAGPIGATVLWMDGESFVDAVDRVPRSRARVEAEVERRLTRDPDA